MSDYSRYAIYVLAEGALHEEASRWLGWDPRTGKTLPHPDVDGLSAPVEDLTATPRKYGFHGTIKPPFRLAAGESRATLETACETVLSGLQSAQVDRLVVGPLSGFVAMLPQNPSASLNRLAGEVVEKLDGLRAPASDDELARRRKSGLTPRQDALLMRWGYPYVMEEFRFHMTLSGKRSTEEAASLADRLGRHFAPVIPIPFDVNALGLLGEDATGRFHLIRTYRLAG